MNIEEQFNKDLHGDIELAGNAIRYNGYILVNNEDDSQTILFDNGNLYYLKDKKVVKRIASDDVFFISKHIMTSVKNVINSNETYIEKYKYKFVFDEVELIFYGSVKESEENDFILIKMFVDKENKSISISNIFLPLDQRQRGFGKKIIKEIYETVKKHEFKVYLVQMVESFYDRMVKRNAKVIIPLDTVEITDETRL